MAGFENRNIFTDPVLKEISNPFIHFVDSRNRWVTFVVNNILYMEETNDDTFDIKFVDGSTYHIELAPNESMNMKAINRLMGFPLGSNVYD